MRYRLAGVDQHKRSHGAGERNEFRDGVDYTDQQAGGGIAWSVGEIPTIALAIAVVISWARSDEKVSKRLDREADRDGDAELAEYNAMLAERGGSR